ncbi:receptor like protein 24-like [Silene latifolia]|uniref:receptor like protein 24-like n=1 Tax=Silene latifolia TaxID=37657 RepID=UPI003D77BF65
MGNTVISCLRIYTFILFNTRWCRCNENSPNNSTERCIPSERAALLNFKHNLTYFDKDVSSSWIGEECCNWGRVVCDSKTGHVLELDLSGDGTNSFLKMNKLESLVYLLQLKQLESLDLRFNDFTYSSIPRFMGLMKELRFPSKLEYLDLSNNKLSGKMPTSILGKLSKLRSLDISYNPLEGTILSKTHFANLSTLTYLCMSHTMLTLNLPSNWVPPFQLLELFADTCKINGQIPPWLQTQKYLYKLHLSSANISGFMPNWFHTMQQLDWVVLSDNKLSGSPIYPINFSTINLSNNSLSGLIFPKGSKAEVYHQANEINLSNNYINGSFPEGLGHIMPYLTILYLSNNQIEGPIPNSLCHFTSLVTLDLQNNSLTGVIPNCWGLGQIMLNLRGLILSNNQIKGPIPESLCQLTSLIFVDIQNNSLSGEISDCWANTPLSFIRLSYNKLKGRIPCFNNIISNKFEISDGFYLHLNDNMLSGGIPVKKV